MYESLRSGIHSPLLYNHVTWKKKVWRRMVRSFQLVEKVVKENEGRLETESPDSQVDGGFVMGSRAVMALSGGMDSDLVTPEIAKGWARRHLCEL